MKLKLPDYDYNKLGKNIVGAVAMPPATVFASTGDVEQAKHAALLGLGAAAVLLVGFVQTPYKRTQAEKDTQATLPQDTD